ncbi:phosphatase PAP2 family protein, partial [Micromonospora sp. 15K316]|uniref:phosphatase PAP2 family protein n=1 Tax=Micromonospora sp. 15K316 TaxID=2530376 RepID=UPI0014042715
VWAGLLGTALVVAAVLGAGVAKKVIVRPDLAVETSTTHNSFPSGHVAAAMALLLAVLLVLPASARWWFALPGATGVSTVAAATMIAGWHRFSDVVGAVLLAAALSCLAAAALARSGTRAGTGTAGHPGTAGLAVAALGLLGLLGLLGGVPQLAPDAVGGVFVAIAAAGGFVVLVVVAVLLVVAPVEFGTPASPRAKRTNAPRIGDRYQQP